MNKFIEWLLGLFKKPEPIKPEPKPTRSLAWGKKLTHECREKVFQIANNLQVDADYLMAVMAFESAETFRPDIKNFAGSGATGLIQFMPVTARGLGTTVEELARMTVLEQLDWVYTYFKPYSGRLHTLSDVYMAVLWPRGIGKPEDYVLWSRADKPTTYRQNSGLDLNGNGEITKAEAAQKVQAALDKGRQSKYMWVGE